jgi:hypothetical protein
MFDFLEAFEKRMEWIGIIESIVNRRGRDMEIECDYFDTFIHNGKDTVRRQRLRYG